MAPQIDISEKILSKSSAFDGSEFQAFYKPEEDVLQLFTKGFLRENLDTLEHHNYFPMIAKREQGAEQSDVAEALVGDHGYHCVGGFGVSAEVLMEIGGMDHHLLVERDAAEFGEAGKVFKAVSGNVPVSETLDPSISAHKETLEEVLLFNSDGKLLSGSMNGELLEKPYENSPNETISYTDEPGFELQVLDRVLAPGLIGHGGIYVNGEKVPGNPAFYFHVRPNTDTEEKGNGRNSGQFVFPLRIVLNERVAGVAHAETRPLDLVHHADDRFNPSSNELDVYICPGGMLFGRQTGGDFAGEFFHFEEGKLSSYDSSNFGVSELWVPKRKGIVGPDNIALAELLSSYK
ncbi:MAG: hypothetical protein ACE5FT_03090 [Candidatus Nanoarchaeia archaeon]